MKRHNKSKELTDQEVLAYCSKEVAKWPKWKRDNADLLFEENHLKRKKHEIKSKKAK